MEPVSTHLHSTSKKKKNDNTFIDVIPGTSSTLRVCFQKSMSPNVCHPTNIFVSLRTSLAMGQQHLICESLDLPSRVMIHFAEGSLAPEKHPWNSEHPQGLFICLNHTLYLNTPLHRAQCQEGTCSPKPSPCSPMAPTHFSTTLL